MWLWFRFGYRKQIQNNIQGNGGNDTIDGGSDKYGVEATSGID